MFYQGKDKEYSLDDYKIIGHRDQKIKRNAFKFNMAYLYLGY
jgi:hypothetical protein